jgi:hypothetical protein
MMSSEMTSISSAKDENCSSEGFMRNEKQGARYVTTIVSIADKFIISLLAIFTTALDHRLPDDFD